MGAACGQLAARSVVASQKQADTARERERERGREESQKALLLPCLGLLIRQKVPIGQGYAMLCRVLCFDCRAQGIEACGNVIGKVCPRFSSKPPKR